MKVDPKIQYKSETGKTAFFNVEAERLTQELDSVMMEGMSGEEIRSLIDYDCSHNVKLGIFLDQIPTELQECENLIIHSPEYVEWLESRLEQLTAP